MRAWLYDLIRTDPALQSELSLTEAQLTARVVPRESQDDFNLPKPFFVYGMGNVTNEDLAEDDDHEAYRQFFQVWIHDEGGDFSLIDDCVEIIKRRLIGASNAAAMVTLVKWLETSGEFSNQTYNTNFRYI